MEVFGEPFFELDAAALALARRERRLAEIVSDASTDLIATFGFDGRVQSVNPASEAILGYRPEELVGRDRTDLIIDEDTKLRTFKNEIRFNEVAFKG